MEIAEIFDNYVRYFIKIFEINLFLYFTYTKILNYKDSNFKKEFIYIIITIIVSICYTGLIPIIPPILIITIICVIDGLSIMILLKHKGNYCIFVVILSFVITYLIYFFSVINSGILLRIINPNINYETALSFITIPLCMTVMYYLLSKIKRWKNGFSFLKDTNTIEQLSRYINPLALLLVIIFGVIQDSYNTPLNLTIFSITFLFTVIIIMFIRFQITNYYKKNMKDKTIQVQKAEIEEDKKIIDDIKEENLKLANVVHKYNKRISSIEMALENAISSDYNTEVAKELSIILNDTKEISKNFAKESEVTKMKLPSTNIPGIDNMFKYMQNEALKNNIHFDLKLNDNIHRLIEEIIPKDKFETLLGDHLQDAIIAINSSKNEYRSILVTLGIVDGCYELSIYDTGVEFEIDTLLKLGKEQITTHKDTGGSGIGFMTTFETLRNTKASLIIEEYIPETTSFTKSVNIRFDGKCEYRVYSYRWKEIEEKNKDKRIIIKNIE